MAESFISLLPLYAAPKILLVGDKIPCHSAKIEHKPIERILSEVNREAWVEGLYTHEKDLGMVKRYQNKDGSYKNDFDENKFSEWIKIIEENTALCDMENNKVGKGVFVPPGMMLPKDTFIPSTGIIKLDPTREELATKVHCSALQDLNSVERKIYGLIDPSRRGGLLDFINHGPDDDEIENFEFKIPSLRKYIAISNLRSIIKFYNGYAIMGVEAIQDIDGGAYGTQLLWSYAQPDEYLSYDGCMSDKPKILLFDNRNGHNGEIIDSNSYSLKIINILIDTGELTLLKTAPLTRWELMKNTDELNLIVTADDPYTSNHFEPIKVSIPYAYLRDYFKRNPKANRIIVKTY